MKWTKASECYPPNEDRVFVCLGYYLEGEPNGKRYHYWIGIARHCHLLGWMHDFKKKVEYPDCILYRKPMDIEFPEGIENIPLKKKPNPVS